jgi:hypothetical protein
MRSRCSSEGLVALGGAIVLLGVFGGFGRHSQAAPSTPAFTLATFLCPPGRRACSGSRWPLRCIYLLLPAAALSWRTAAPPPSTAVCRHGINGYLYCNMPDLTFSQGQRVRFHVLAMGTEGEPWGHGRVGRPPGSACLGE